MLLAALRPCARKTGRCHVAEGARRRQGRSPLARVVWNHWSPPRCLWEAVVREHVHAVYVRDAIRKVSEEERLLKGLASLGNTAKMTGMRVTASEPARSSEGGAWSCIAVWSGSMLLGSWKVLCDTGQGLVGGQRETSGGMLVAVGGRGGALADTEQGRQLESVVRVCQHGLVATTLAWARVSGSRGRNVGAESSVLLPQRHDGLVVQAERVVRRSGVWSSEASA